MSPQYALSAFRLLDPEVERQPHRDDRRTATTRRERRRRVPFLALRRQRSRSPAAAPCGPAPQAC